MFLWGWRLAAGENVPLSESVGLQQTLPKNSWLYLMRMEVGRGGRVGGGGDVGGESFQEAMSNFLNILGQRIFKEEKGYTGADWQMRRVKA